jgi:hypothetical protein
MKKQISDSYPMSRYVIQYHYLLIYAWLGLFCFTNKVSARQD